MLTRLLKKLQGRMSASSAGKKCGPGSRLPFQRPQFPVEDPLVWCQSGCARRSFLVVIYCISRVYAAGWNVSKTVPRVAVLSPRAVDPGCIRVALRSKMEEEMVPPHPCSKSQEHSRQRDPTRSLLNPDLGHGSSTSDRSVSGLARGVGISFKILLNKSITVMPRLLKDPIPTHLPVGHSKLALDSDLEDLQFNRTSKIHNSIITMFTLNYSSSSSRLHRR
jgi:hypothetical protein